VIVIELYRKNAQLSVFVVAVKSPSQQSSRFLDLADFCVCVCVSSFSVSIEQQQHNSDLCERRSSVSALVNNLLAFGLSQILCVGMQYVSAAHTKVTVSALVNNLLAFFGLSRFCDCGNAVCPQHCTH